MRLVAAGPPFVGGPGLVGRHPIMVEVGVPLQHMPMQQVEQENRVSPQPGSAHGVAGGGGGDGVAGASGWGLGGGVAGGRRAAGEEEGVVEGEAWLSEEEARLVQRFDPSDPQLDTIGFFVAKFVKVAPVGAV